MYQIDNSTAALVQPAPTAFGTAGYFTDGNPAVGQAATVLPAEFMNSLMLEGLNVLSAAGIAPAKGSYNQLAQAIKTIIQGGATTYAADTGVANAYVLALTPAITAYTGTTKVRGLVAHTNTGACTLDAGGGAKALVGLAHSALQGGEMVAGGYFEAQYNVALGKFILLWCTGAAEQVANATQSQHALTLGQAQSGTSTYAVDTGVANAYVLALTPAVTAYNSPLKVRGQVNATNTGASTLDAGAGPKALVGLAHAALQGGEMVAGGYFEAEYNTTLGKFILLFCTGAPEQVANATQSQQALPLGQASSLFGGQAGKIEWFATMTPPSTHLAANGSAISRTTYASLFNAITVAATGNVTSGSPTITAVASTAAMWVGMPISGPGIPLSATIASIVANTSITLSINATATTASAALVICPFGVGDGSTTFNIPDMRGRVPRGWDNGAGLDAGRIFGSGQADGNASHNHGVSDPGHAHGVNDPGHMHSVQAGSALVSIAAGGSQYGVFSGQQNTTSSGVGVSIQTALTNISTQLAGGTEARMKNIALLPCIKY
ncbi:tail fiber protein [Pseudomonas fluorescens group sp. PF-69]